MKYSVPNGPSYHKPARGYQASGSSMLCDVVINFLGPGPAYNEWLASHQDHYVIQVAVYFGPDGPAQQEDGTIDFHPKSWSKTLHRVACESVRVPGLHDTLICGAREELAGELLRGDTVLCTICGP
jgi:hypothetical protein